MISLRKITEAGRLHLGSLQWQPGAGRHSISTWGASLRLETCTWITVDSPKQDKYGGGSILIARHSPSRLQLFPHSPTLVVSRVHLPWSCSTSSLVRWQILWIGYYQLIQQIALATSLALVWWRMSASMTLERVFRQSAWRSRSLDTLHMSYASTIQGEGEWVLGTSHISSNSGDTQRLRSTFKDHLCSTAVPFLAEVFADYYESKIASIHQYMSQITWAYICSNESSASLTLPGFQRQSFSVSSLFLHPSLQN